METVPFRKLDRRSGQVYIETASAPASLFLNGPAWIHETPFLPQGWEELSIHGAASLMHSAMRILLSDQRSLTSALFANVPWRIASYLWDCLGRCKKQTLHMWKLFATAYPGQFPETERYRSMKIEGPRVSMREYLGLVKSENLSWLVVLTLGASYARVPELVGISEIKNLVALEVATPAYLGAFSEGADVPVTALNDRIVRTWSELAQTADAFAHLRVLILWYQIDLSRVALRYLRALPALQYVVAHECPGISSAFFGDRKVEEVDGWAIERMRHCRPSTLYEFYQASEKEAKLAETPVLDFQVGQRGNSPSHSPPTSLHSAIYLQRTALESPGRVDPEPSIRKRKRVRALDSHGEQSQPRKAVMKSRPKDLGDVLKDFF